jgi:uncharacterized membrane protein
MLAWFREHPPVAIAVLVGLTCAVLVILWDLISLFVPPVIPYQDFIGRYLLLYVGVYLVIMTARSRGLLRRPPER